MRLIRYESGTGVRPAASMGSSDFYDVGDVIADFTGEALHPYCLRRVADAVQTGGRPVVDPSAHRLAAPLHAPGKIVCVGLNYQDHAAETAMDVPSEPILFMKAPTTIVGPNDAIVIPPGSTQTDYEVELGVVIGSRALYLPDQSSAADVIAGYTICNDVSERDCQLNRGGQWDKGKSFPSFNPLGPWIVTTDEVPDPQALELSLHVNGVPRQSANTADMIFGAHYLVFYISQFMELLPGDLINTGTPPGVALGRGLDAYLTAGDEVETAIGGLGVQRNPVIANQVDPTSTQAVVASAGEVNRGR